MRLKKTVAYLTARAQIN